MQKKQKQRSPYNENCIKTWTCEEFLPEVMSNIKYHISNNSIEKMRLKLAKYRNVPLYGAYTIMWTCISQENQIPTLGKLR